MADDPKELNALNSFQKENIFEAKIRLTASFSLAESVLTKDEFEEYCDDVAAVNVHIDKILKKLK